MSLDIFEVGGLSIFGNTLPATTFTGDITLGANNIISDAFTVANDGTVTTLSTIAGDYWPIGDANTIITAIDSSPEDDLRITVSLGMGGTG